jgi:hypothetical protein
MPSDFGSPVDMSRVRSALESGEWAIDCWEAEPRLWYLRPSTTNAIGKLIDCSWGGKCIFLGESGCDLQHADRPSGCRLLEPGKDDCIDHGAGKLEAGEAWKPYNLYDLACSIEFDI